MADLTVEEFSALPEKIKQDYEKVGDIYKPVLESKLLATEGKVSTLKASLDGLDAKLKDIQKQESEKIEAAKKEALEQAKSKGDVSAAEKLYKEQMDDLKQRMEELQKQSEEKITKMTQQIKHEKELLLIESLTSEYAMEKHQKTFKKLLRSYIQYNSEAGKYIFLNEDGSASSLDLAGFKSWIEKSEEFDPLSKAKVNTGGFAKGNTGGDSRSTSDSQDKLSPVQRMNRARTNKKS